MFQLRLVLARSTGLRIRYAAEHPASAFVSALLPRRLHVAVAPTHAVPIESPFRPFVRTLMTSPSADQKVGPISAAEDASPVQREDPDALGGAAEAAPTPVGTKAAPKKPAAPRKKRATKADAATAAAQTDAASADAQDTDAAKAAKPAAAQRKKRATKADAAKAAAEAEDPPAADAGDSAPPAKPAAARKKRPTKAEAAKAAAQTDEAAADGADAPAPAPAKRARAAPAKGEEGADDQADTEFKPKKKRGPASTLPLLPTGTKYDEKTMRPDTKGMKATRIMSWNVAGLRSIIKKDEDILTKLVDLESVDVLCLQEHKLQDKNVEDVRAAMKLSADWAEYFTCSAPPRLGYSGVAVLCRKSTVGEPLSVQFGLGMPEHDAEGRVVTVEFPSFWVVNTYVPNSGSELARLEYRHDKWDPALAAHLKKLEQTKPVIATGDFNCARHPLDIHNARNNVKSAGFTPQERASFEKVYTDNKLVDTFRLQHPDVYGYTYFGHRMGMRAKGKGWRLDYFLVSEKLTDRCADTFVLQEFLGSDHCPLGLVLKTVE